MFAFIDDAIIFISAIGKEIEKSAKQPGCEDLALWRQSATNHLYWAAATTPPGSGETIAAKWESILFHMIDQHANLPNPLFPACAHGVLNEENHEKQWLEQSKDSSQIQSDN